MCSRRRHVTFRLSGRPCNRITNHMKHLTPLLFVLLYENHLSQDPTFSIVLRVPQLSFLSLSSSQSPFNSPNNHRSALSLSISPSISDNIALLPSCHMMIFIDHSTLSDIFTVLLSIHLNHLSTINGSKQALVLNAQFFVCGCECMRSGSILCRLAYFVHIIYS
ncbi:hypothetical protein GYMLUDRAFT_903134 [Collybiopsis luxurians FD-317 M1]|uniref:Uncharacterized protein n=1 Tax=Collybiopsis luxurians FD-317 M1 TaxID=944289 RepID=A0A0D0AVP2_9AGAR|nr:hypothetical protein GYMLUDRAFT_903134 [Collybiopsis luxurians FD-317 M1]